MRKGQVLTLVALPLIFALPLLAYLPAPANFEAALSDDVIQTHWDEVDGATKYSVDVIAIYDVDVNSDDEADTMDFDFGTTETSLDIPVQDLMMDIDGDDEGDLLPATVILRVKALNPPARNGNRQNNPFSATEVIHLTDSQ